MRKAICLFLSVLFLLAGFIMPVSAGEADPFDLDQLHCRYAILVDADNPTEALYGIEKNADVQCATGSTVKILTTIVTLENGNLDDLVTISANAVDFSAKNSLMGLYQGEQWTLRDLLYGLMLPSGNDAAVAIAEHIAGSTKAFANLMNEKAAEIGMTSSHFVTVNGRDDKNHYSTARDMAVLTAYALKNEEFCKIVGTAHYTCTCAAGNHAIELTNTNRLIADQVSSDGSYTPQSCLYEGAIGVKTGDTNNAGKCFIGAARRGGITLIGVGLGGCLDDEQYQTKVQYQKEKQKDPYNAQRFTDVIAMFDYAFTNLSVMLTMQDLIELGLPTEFDVQIENYAPSDEDSGRIKLKAEVNPNTPIQLMKPYYAELKKSIRDCAVTSISNSLFAPVMEGDTLGTVTYNIDAAGVQLNYNLLADRSVEEGVLATETSDGIPLEEVPRLMSDPTGVDGTVVKPVEETASSPLKTVLFVVLGLLLLAMLVFVALVIRAKIRREKRRKARAARKKREREMMQRRYRDE